MNADFKPDSYTSFPFTGKNRCQEICESRDECQVLLFLLQENVPFFVCIFRVVFFKSAILTWKAIISKNFVCYVYNFGLFMF